MLFIRRFKSKKHFLLEIYTSMKLKTLFILFVFVLQGCNSMSGKAINVDLPETSQTTIHKLKVGEEISFKTNVHGSVGMAAEHILADDGVLELKESKIIYDNPNFKGAGGDGGMKKFTFKALTKGKTKVIIQKIFRGELEKEIILDMEVI